MRVAYFDRTRALAILLVVSIHAWDTFVIRSDFVTSLEGWAVHQLVHIVGRYGVPLFVMLTGALMLDRPYFDIRAFLLKKVPRFLGALMVAAIIYLLVSKELFNASFTAIPYKFLNGVPLSTYIMGYPIGGYHLWYMYMLVGLYVSLPFLAKMLGALSELEVRYLMIFSIILVVIPWTLKVGYFGFSYAISYSFVLQTYGLYAVTGYWLHKHKGMQRLSINSRCWMLLVSTLAAVIVKIMLDYVPGAPMPADGMVWYDSVYIYVPSTILFSILRDYAPSNDIPGSVVMTISRASFSIYLWHVLVILSVVYVDMRIEANPFLMAAVAVPPGMVLGVIVYSALQKGRLNWLVR